MCGRECLKADGAEWALFSVPGPDIRDQVGIFLEGLTRRTREWVGLGGGDSFLWGAL